jgi:hypothetical protein
MPSFLPWLWLLAVFVPLVLLERWVHRHVQGVWLLVFRHHDVAMVLYSIVMLPGVLIHETSHWLMATVLGARTGRFSVVPERLPDGTLRLGYVETEHTDLVREALIGVAPLLAGSTIVMAVSYGLLGVGPLGDALARGDLGAALQHLQIVLTAPDAWLWIYLVFTVSNSMLPSASDRRAWLPLLAFVGILLAALLYAGFDALVFDLFTGPVDAAVRSLAAAFTITVALDVIFVPFIWLIEQGMMRLTGLKVDY